MGRPEKFKHPVTATFRVEKDTYEQIEKIRWREHADFGEIVRRAVDDYVKIHADGNETFKLDQFQDPDFKAYPATMSSKEKWSRFIRENTNKEERSELDMIAKHIRSEIDAKNWLESKNK